MPRRDDNALIRQYDIFTHFESIALSFNHWITPYRNSTDPKRIPERRRHLFKFHHALRARLLVDAEKRWDAFLFQVSGDSLVCGEHELFDNAMCDIARRPCDSRHFSQRIELDRRLWHIEVDGA